MLVAFSSSSDCSRATAFVLAGMMAVAYFMAHAPKSFFPVVNVGDLAIMFCFVFLYLTAAGAGPYSVDVNWKQFSPHCFA